MITVWNITKLICKTDNASLTNVVYRIIWECKKQDSSGIFVFETGACTLPQPDPNDFIQFNNLTKTEVVSWVHLVLGQDYLNTIETRLTERLTERLNTVELNPPFSN